MRFWDTSALLPLIFREATSPTVADLLRRDGEASVWWGTWVECSVAVSRLRREGRLNEETEGEARSRLDLLARTWRETRPYDDLRLLTALLSRDHPLKTADGTGFVCLDKGLRRAASEEGFHVLPHVEVA